jgi:hypothetical protein
MINKINKLNERKPHTIQQQDPVVRSPRTLNSAGINNPEGPEKYNNTEVKYGATFYSCHTALDTCCCKI